MIRPAEPQAGVGSVAGRDASCRGETESMSCAYRSLKPAKKPMPIADVSATYRAEVGWTSFVPAPRPVLATCR